MVLVLDMEKTASVASRTSVFILKYVKTNNFKDAYTPWKAVFTEAPLAQVGTYTNGAKILRALIAESKDAAQQKTYLNELMAVHDQRIKYLDQLNGLVRTPTTKGSIWV